MSRSMTQKSDLSYSSLGDQLPTVTNQTESSCVRGINSEESTGESSNEQVIIMVGWNVHKKYGMHEVEGVVESYNTETKIYEVRYKDGKSEKVTAENVVKYLSPTKPGSEQPSGSSLRIRAQNAVRIPQARTGAKRPSAGTAPAQQSRRVSRGSAEGEVPTADSVDKRNKRYSSLRSNAGPARKAVKRPRAGTAPARQSRPVSRGSSAGEVPTTAAGNEGKKRYRSLRINAGP